jgi:aspartate kinase
VIVLKFGGTSLGDAPRIRRALERVKEAGPGPRLVVCSAMAGVTDALVDLVERAVARDGSAALAGLERLAARHEETLAGLGLEGSPASRRCGELLRELRVTLRGLRHLGRDDPRARDQALCFGELLSSEMVAGALEAGGQATRWIDARDLLVTEERSGGARPDLEATRERAAACIQAGAGEAEISVLGGFVGRSASGRPTHLGRGGSDLSASVLGAALEAERVEIWTDVSGLMTADPRLVPEARPLRRISFGEAAALARFGARVLHPETIAPAVEAGVPVVVRNSLRPADPGTVIDRGGGEAGGTRALACRAGAALLRLRGRPGLASLELLRRAVARLREGGRRLSLVAAGEGTLTLLLDEKQPDTLRAELAELGEIEVLDRLGLICAVGSERGGQAGPSVAVASRLQGERVHLLWSGPGRGQVVVAVPEPRAVPLLRELHRDLIETVPAGAAGGEHVGEGRE